MDRSLPGSSVQETLQARILEWVATSFSRGSSRPWDRTVPLLHWQAGSLPLSHQGSPYANTLTVLYTGFEHLWRLASAEGSGANPLMTPRMNVISKSSCGFCTFKPNVNLNGKALVCKQAGKVNYLICKNPSSFS